MNANVSPERIAAIAAGLAEKWPDAVVELDHANAYQLLVATILSAQSTDKMINTLTPAVFARYPDPAALAKVEPAELEPMIFSSGFYRAKAKNVIAMARRVVERFGGVIPDTMEGLVDLPGVARKTANVVLGSVFGKNEGVVVDTHVARLALRLGLTTNSDPVKIEQDLMRALPRDQWSIFAQRLIWHGRRVCFAKKPDCEHCPLAPVCPSAGLGLPALARGSGAKIAQRPARARTRPAGAKPDPGAKRKAAKPTRPITSNAKPAKSGARIAATAKPAAPNTARSAKHHAARPARARKEQRI
ncbi:MAG TPA: endonuclease III [Kofleriaceae bacterium]|nr:endonuclease III [Kofleriaceae bacterium]